MIFVSVGTHPQQFDRLLKKIDELIEQGKITDKVIAQTGYSAYNPKNYSAKKFIGIEEFDRMIKKADLFITHAGEGNIGTALQLEKKMVVVPRRYKFDEHTNDHQMELAEAVEKENQAIVVYEINELAEAIRKANKLKTKKTEHAKRIINLIESSVREW